MITYSEKTAGRSGSDASGSGFQEYIYVARVTAGEDTDAVASTIRAGVPATRGGLTLGSVMPDAIEGTDDFYLVRVRYQVLGLVAPDTGDDEFSFDTTGGTEHVTQSIQTTSSRAPRSPSGDATVAPDFGGAVGVSKDGVQGVDIGVSSFSFTRTVYLPGSSVNVALVNAFKSLTYKTNAGNASVTMDNGVTLTFTDGQLLFRGARGSKRRSQQDYQIQLCFSAQEDVTDITIGEFADISKPAWHYIWVIYEEQEDTSNYVKILKPKYVYVEQMYRKATFAPLPLT